MISRDRFILDLARVPVILSVIRGNCAHNVWLLPSIVMFGD